MNMITGYNTDVKRNEVDFHVQTEDKGTGNPFIESLIYVGGQVLAAKRTSYADILAEGRGEKAIVGVMDQQHRSMITAIRKGRFDSKVKDLLDGSATGQQSIIQAELTSEMSSEVLPPGPESPSERTLDEVILDYLTTEAQQEHLVLSLGDEVELTYGRQSVVTMRTASSKNGLPVAGAVVTVKMISTAHDPIILGEGKTDERGSVVLPVEIPSTVDGACALIITAASDLGKAELKYLL